MTEELTNDDFFDEGLGNVNSPDLVKAIEREFKELIANEDQIAELETLMSACKAVVSEIKRKKLPDLLKEFGSEIWRDPDSGIAIELETAVNSTLPKDQEKRNEIYDALRPIGIEEVLVEELNTKFIPGDRRVLVLREFLGLPEVIQDLIDDESDDADQPGDQEDAVQPLTPQEKDILRQARIACGVDNEGFPTDEKLGVHAARFKSWLKKRIEAGQGQEVLDAGIWHGKQAKVVRPKK